MQKSSPSFADRLLRAVPVHFIALVCAIALFSFFGCVKLPSLYGPDVTSRPQATIEPSHRDIAGVTGPGSVTPAASRRDVPGVAVPREVTHEKSESTKSIQALVNWQAGLFILGGLACLSLGGLCFYGGQIIPGLKFILAGLLLPIFGIWFAYHWLLVVILVLLAGGALFLATHYAMIKPILDKLESFGASVLTKAESEVQKIVTPAPAPSANVTIHSPASVTVVHNLTPQPFQASK